MGSTFTFAVSFASALTKVVLVSARATTHWVDGGPQRFLSLEFDQKGSDVQASVPSDPVKALAGYYILFALVDDIPSVGKIVRITPAPAVRPAWQTVSINSADASASEAGSDAATVTVTRDMTNAPLRVDYMIGGTAVNGVDYNAISNFVTIPAGALSANVTIVPIDDTLAEGSETASLFVGPTASCNIGVGTNATVTLLDNGPAPPALALSLTALGGGYLLRVEGAASQVIDIEVSSTLGNWERLTTMINASGTNRLYDTFGTNSSLFFRARELP